MHNDSRLAMLVVVAAVPSTSLLLLNVGCVCDVAAAAWVRVSRGC